jgi:hypothetical protein
LTDFFDTTVGGARDEMRHPIRAALIDRLYDLRLATSRRARSIETAASSIPRQKVLIVGVEVPKRSGALKAITDQMGVSKHDVTISTVLMKPKGKFENVDDAINAAPEPLIAYDYLVIADDDVELPPNFLDRLIGAAALTNLTVSQPAHRFQSYASFDLTRRGFGTAVRETSFVEIGPITLIRKDAFSALIPFPSSRWAWGLDLIWAKICRVNGWRMGVIDATPIRHLQPVGNSYSRGEAISEAKHLLNAHGVVTRRADLMARGSEQVQR